MTRYVLLILTIACLAEFIETKPWVYESETVDNTEALPTSQQSNGNDKRPAPKRLLVDRKPPMRNRISPGKDDTKRSSANKHNQTKVTETLIDSVKIDNRSASQEMLLSTTVSSLVSEDEVEGTTPFYWTPFVDPSLCITSGPSVFCVDILNYPDKMISSILATDGSTLTDYFPPLDTLSPSASETVETTVENPEMPQSRKAKIRPTFPIVPEARKSSADQSQLCRSATIETPVKMARNTQGDYLAIVNQDNIRQTITVERCLNENGPCQFAKNFPAGYEATCKQKYTKHNLAALKDGKIQQDTFVFPSCCVCEVTARHFLPKHEKVAFPDEN